MLNKLNRRSAIERDPKSSPKLHLQCMLHFLIPIEILLTDPGIVPVGLDHYGYEGDVLRR